MGLKSFIVLDTKNKRKLPKEFQADNNRYSDSFVEYFLKKFTKKGDKIFDPFAGLGTTMLIAEEMKRVPYGIELDEKRFDYVKSLLNNKTNLIFGDTRKLDSFNLPKFDFCITSPPYMSEECKEYALSAYKTIGKYEKYIEEIGEVYKKISKVMKPGKYVVVEVSNIKRDNITPLAWDIAKEISKHLHFEGEIIIGWKGFYAPKKYSIDQNHSYALVFRRLR